MMRMTESETGLEKLGGGFHTRFQTDPPDKTSSFYLKRGDAKNQKQIVGPKSVADPKLPFIELLALS